MIKSAVAMVSVRWRIPQRLYAVRGPTSSVIEEKKRRRKEEGVEFKKCLPRRWQNPADSSLLSETNDYWGYAWCWLRHTSNVTGSRGWLGAM